MEEIKDEKYCISYDPDNAIIMCEGSLLLNGAPAYAPILELLKKAAEAHDPNKLTVDIRGLKFLNSSGINMMTKFIMYVSDINPLQLDLVIIAWKHVAWQEKLTINLTRLMPALRIQLEQA